VHPFRLRSRILWLLPVCGFTVLVVLSFSCPTLSAADDIDFGREIRPILSDKCFQCHGADEGTRSAELRLDLREEAIAPRDGTAAIVPGKPDQSLLVNRICANDPDERMPPAESNKSLSPAQVELLQKWISQGARYADHWAFQPVEPVVVPDRSASGWARNEIDIFIEQRLHAAGLKPSPTADRATLIRRLYQDLTGLLPSPAEAERFQTDSAPNAYEKLVDRLLESPHYGERWGRHWLDQARYADSHGFTIDGVRTMWPYRDWVIQALNSDMPFDQFTIEQLAGDLLPAPSKSQLVATAFHRNTMINQEGGVKPDQYRHEAIIDRVNTTGSVWLGLTVGCAQCHSHKFDPLTHQEYYQLYAFFNRCQDANNTGSTVSVYQSEMFGLGPAEIAGLEKWRDLKKKVRDQEAQDQQAERARLLQYDWKWTSAEVGDIVTEANGTFQKLSDGTFLSDQNGGQNDTYHIALQAPANGLTALRVRVLTDPALPQQGPGLGKDGDFLLTGAVLRVDGKQVSFSHAVADAETPSTPAAAVIDQNKRSGWSIPVSKEASTKKKTDRDSPDAQPAFHELILLLSQRLTGNPEIVLDLAHDGTAGRLIGRFGVDLSSAQKVPKAAGESVTLQKLRQEMRELESLIPGRGEAESQMIMADMTQPPETFRLSRGDFLQPAKEEGALLPGVPAALTAHLPSLPEFHNRLQLARWLVSPENPLTARVVVNRMWMHYFGRGLVETENDFGFQGSPPTHPELLDWLAGELMRRRWSMKQIHRLLVTSATYRQSSQQRLDVQTIDPRNLLLSQQSRVRVEAEIVRDMALAASGRLVPKIGGPSVFPPQPDGVYSFTQTKKSWPESKDANRYRRTMYTAFYRSAPYPLLTTFDSPDFTSVCTQRPRSNTPLQSLTLANDLVFVELAQGLAERMYAETSPHAEMGERMDYLFRLCLTRTPEVAEQEILTRYWNTERARYSGDDSSISKLIQGTPPSGVTGEDFAAWMSTARVLMNTDEFVTRN